jgi:HEPN domain-containing protein
MTVHFLFAGCREERVASELAVVARLRRANTLLEQKSLWDSAQLRPIMPFKFRGRNVSLSKKEVREITGFTFSEVGSDPENWISRARAFKEAAELIANGDGYSPPIPYYYNAGLSLELILKAIAIAKAKVFETNHRLNDLCKLIGVKITNDQECTLELLSELVVWSGRYPIPKNEGQWNNYHDVVQEKHILHEREGKVGKIFANRDRFPTLQNYLALWGIFEQEYSASTKGMA